MFDPLPDQGGFSRRSVLSMLGLGGATLLGACATGTTASTATEAPNGTPARGGRVRLTFAGAGAAETLEPNVGQSPAELACKVIVFDQLFAFEGGKPVPHLAIAAEPVTGGGAVTITLRPKVTWHDGSPLTAQDVVFTFARLADPQRLWPSELSAYFDLARAAAVDTLTVRVPTVQPVGDPATLIAGAGLVIVKQGTTSFTVASAVGTGPYRLTAFEAGGEARLARYDAHWGGAPYADEIVLLSIDDPQARVNAVKGNQADYASDIPFVTARQGAPGKGLQIRKAGESLRTSYGFVFNTTRKLGGDSRVRMALRLGVDRQALVDTVFLGLGVTANDLFGAGAMYYQDAPVPRRDIDRAKRLLDEAGAVGQPFVIRSADYEVGLNASAEVFAEQLRGLGLRATTKIVNTTDYFDKDGLAQCDAVSFPLGPFSLAVTYTRSAAYPALALPDPALRHAVATAISTTSDTERATAWKTAQDVMTDHGNWLVWGRADVHCVARDNLVGVDARESPKYPWLGKAGFLP